jgi:nucleoside-diphosphate-sugar epimerase
MKTALITGATGFVGSHVCRRLVHEHWGVGIIVRPNSSLDPLIDVADSIQVHVHDGSLEGMCRIVSTAAPQVVFHLASCFVAEHQTADVSRLVLNNVMFGTQLAEAMALSRVFRMVNTGTSWQHYQNMAYSPVCLYAATKQAFEAILQYYHERFAWRIVTLKLFDTYGPSDLRTKLFSLLRKLGPESPPFPMSGGDQSLDLVYIDDVVEAYLTAARRLLAPGPPVMEAFAVSSQAPMSLRRIVETYQQVTGSKFTVAWGRLPYRSREVMQPWAEGVMLPGWRPAIGLEEGIRLMENKE